MLFMVTFPLTHHSYKERLSRFLEAGAPPSGGVKVLGRWFTASHSKGFMLAKTNEPKLLFTFVSERVDKMDYVIEPVLTDEEAAAVLKEMM
jgi:hypothetical protein